MKVIVSQSGKQHTYQLLRALITAGHDVHFYTLFWFKPNSQFWKVLLFALPKSIKNKLVNELGKKYDKNLKRINISHNPLIELSRKLLLKINPKKSDRIQLWADQQHDKWVAKQLKKQDYDIFIGYEMSSLESFKEAKSQKRITILDLAQIHYQEIEELAQKHTSLSHLKENQFRKNLNQIKESEYKLADKIITLSDFAHQSMLKHGIHSNKLWTANLGYNEQVFKYKQKALKQNSFNLIYTGAIIKRKGIIELKKALEEITAITNFEITLTLIGGFIDRETFNKANFTVLHKSFMPHEELVKEYQNADLFVFPSLLDSWAMVVLEAMGCGTPVIITENTGAKDVVSKYGGGNIIKAGNVSELKEVLLKYFNNPQLILEKSEETKIIAINCTWNVYHRNIQNFIRSTVN